MEAADYRENRSITEPAVEHAAGDEIEDHASHGAAKTYEARDLAQQS